MWNCRACSSSPFQAFFGGGAEGKSKSKKSKSEISRTDVETADGASSYTQLTFVEPSELEVELKCKAWENYVHQRAKMFWGTGGQIHHLLKSIARSVDKRDDPVLSDDPEHCVIWHGEVTEDGFPVVELKKPDEPNPQPTYVSRTLVFLYADEEAYEELRTKPHKAPFPMACRERLCVNLTHISLDDDDDISDASTLNK
eukprot:GHVN01033617.1.p1 GENE.GHVN01033617.1~~GHVN01033617.1.p1  ORF type:complete len:199 (+),score=15.79 GHVN01033617.1:116-712(+)